MGHQTVLPCGSVSMLFKTFLDLPAYRHLYWFSTGNDFLASCLSFFPLCSLLSHCATETTGHGISVIKCV